MSSNITKYPEYVINIAYICGIITDSGYNIQIRKPIDDR